MAEQLNTGTGTCFIYSFIGFSLGAIWRHSCGRNSISVCTNKMAWRVMSSSASSRLDWRLQSPLPCSYLDPIIPPGFHSNATAKPYSLISSASSPITKLGGLRYRAAIESHHFHQYNKRYSKTGFRFQYQSAL